LKLLVVMPTKYVGNMVISLQTLAAILEQNGTRDTTLVIDERFEALVRAALGDACHLICYPRSGLLNKVSFIRALRREFHDEILDIDGTVLSGRVVSLARARRKTGPDFAKRVAAYDHLVSVDRDRQHCFDDFVLMAAALDVDVTRRHYLTIPTIGPGIPPAIPVTSDRPLVCVHAGATKDYKQWALDRFAALADWLMETGWQVVLVGAGSQEASRVRALEQTMKQVPINVHGRLTLIELVQLLQRCQLFIGNDSGCTWPRRATFPSSHCSAPPNCIGGNQKPNTR